MAFGNRQKVRKLAAGDGEILANGAVRYKIACDKDIDPGGILWSKIIPAGASEHAHKVARVERAALIARIRALVPAK